VAKSSTITLFQTGPGAHPASYKMVMGVFFPGVKRQGRGLKHPLPSRGEIKERLELYFYPHALWAFMACSR